MTLAQSLLRPPTERLEALLPRPSRWLDLTAGVNREGWAGRAELGARLAPNVAGFVAGQVGSRWVDPTVDVRGEVGLRVTF